MPKKSLFLTKKSAGKKSLGKSHPGILRLPHQVATVVPGTSEFEGAKPTGFRHWKKNRGVRCIGPLKMNKNQKLNFYTISINSPLFFWMLFWNNTKKSNKNKDQELRFRPPSNLSHQIRIRGTENHTVHERRTGHSARNGSLREAHEFPGTKIRGVFWKTWKNTLERNMRCWNLWTKMFKTNILIYSPFFWLIEQGALIFVTSLRKNKQQLFRGHLGKCVKTGDLISLLCSSSPRQWCFGR